MSENLVLFDAHAHYDDERFAEEFPGGTDGVIAHVRENGICGILNIGASIRSSRASLELAERYGFIYAAVGIHPGDAQRMERGNDEGALAEIEAMAAHPKAVAIGEIGLDYHYDGTDKERQFWFFEKQLSLAEKLHMPVIIHDRDAHGDCFDILKRHPASYGVFHSFSGSAEMARQLVDMGWYISFSGPVTYKNAAKVKEACAIVPDDRILVETDAPYLPPVPHRGKLNHSGYLHYTAEVVAELRGVMPEEIAACTIANTKRLFGITE